MSRRVRGSSDPAYAGSRRKSLPPLEVGGFRSSSTHASLSGFGFRPWFRAVWYIFASITVLFFPSGASLICATHPGDFITSQSKPASMRDHTCRSLLRGAGAVATAFACTSTFSPDAAVQVTCVFVSKFSEIKPDAWSPSSTHPSGLY
jgi:hypothetical protein